MATPGGSQSAVVSARFSMTPLRLSQALQTNPTTCTSALLAPSLTFTDFFRDDRP